MNGIRRPHRGCDGTGEACRTGGLAVSRRHFLAAAGAAVALPSAAVAAGVKDGPGGGAARPRLAYLVSDLRIPYWDIMWRGVRAAAERRGLAVAVYSAENSPRAELTHLVDVIGQGVDGIIVSPTTSSAAVVILDLAGRAGIPVVIADIGTDGGDHVSYIASDNEAGAHGLGILLADALAERGWGDGTVGIVAIPQKRANGQARTAGFMRAMGERNIRVSGLRQQADFSYRETFDHTADLLAADPGLRAVWLQGSDRYQAALDAIAAAGRAGEVLLLTFDAEPEFLDLIPQGVLLGAGMQQPFLMGEKAVVAMDRHLRGQPVEPLLMLPVLAVSADTIQDQGRLIRRNVLGLDADGEG